MSSTNIYTWTISSMDAYTTQSGYTDVVYTIHWRYRATDESGSYAAEKYGAQSVAPYNSESSSFIPFNELTKDVVVGWLTGSMGIERVGALTASLDSEINEQMYPSVISLGPPWSDPTPTPMPTPIPPDPPGSSGTAGTSGTSGIGGE
jgi:hypothetical protein